MTILNRNQDGCICVGLWPAGKRSYEGSPGGVNATKGSFGVTDNG